MISCKEYAEDLKNNISKTVQSLERPPHLMIIQVGDNPASNSYIKGKIKDCEETGIKATLIKLPAEAKHCDILDVIEDANDDESVDGIIVQLPLPKSIDASLIQHAIKASKDVDGLNDAVAQKKFVPCTPLGVVRYLETNGYEFDGKTAAVLGRSKLVGKPLFDLLEKRNATVTLCHSHTPINTIKSVIRNADMVFTCTNQIESLGYDMLPALGDPTVVIDIGLGRGEDGKLHGNIAAGAAEILKKQPNKLIVSGIGGVGLLTRVTLLQNVLEAYKNQH